MRPPVKQTPKAFMYHQEEAPEGRLFDVEQLAQLGPEWVETPAKFGEEAEDDDDPLPELIKSYEAGDLKLKDDLTDLALRLGAPADIAEQKVDDIRKGIDKALKKRAAIAAVGSAHNGEE